MGVHNVISDANTFGRLMLEHTILSHLARQQIATRSLAITP